MTVRAAVVDRVPLIRRGVIAVLDDIGQTVDDPADVHDWLERTGQNVVLIGVSTPDDWTALHDLHAARPDAQLLAMIDDPSSAAYLRALDAGATGVVARTGTPQQLCSAFTALTRGDCLLPSSAVAVLLGRSARTQPGAPQAVPSAREREWLHLIAGGHTIAELARVAGYSERMMFRLLRSLYARIGVGSRVEALMQAREEGWI